MEIYLLSTDKAQHHNVSTSLSILPRQLLQSSAQKTPFSISNIGQQGKQVLTKSNGPEHLRGTKGCLQGCSRRHSTPCRKHNTTKSGRKFLSFWQMCVDCQKSVAWSLWVSLRGHYSFPKITYILKWHLFTFLKDAQSCKLCAFWLIYHLQSAPSWC